MRVVVIGAGVLGVTTAYFLRRHGMEVTVLEKERDSALGASYGNGGYMQSSAPDPWNAPGILKVFMKAWINSLTGKGDSSAFTARTDALPGLMGWGMQFLRNANAATFLDHLVKNMHLGQYSVKVMEEINKTETLPYDWSHNGGLIIFRDEPSLNSYIQVAEHVGAQGARFEVLSRDSVVSKEPSLTEIGDELVGAVYFPDDARANSRAFCRELAKLTEAHGTQFQYGAEVTDIDQDVGGLTVKTLNDHVAADAVVIAAGAYSPRVGAHVGLDLPIAPAKGFSISVPMAGWDNPPTHVVADMGVHAGVNPMGNRLRVAGTAEFAGFRPGITEERTNYLIGLAEAVFPSFAKTIDPAEIDPWGGHRPLSADGIPMIGTTAVDNVYLNTGHGGLGWTQAAGSAKALADTLAGVKPELDIAPYSISRFAGRTR